MTARRKAPRLVAFGGTTLPPKAAQAETEAPDVARLPDVAGHPVGAAAAGR
ncbi:MAG: hypothetical protein ACFCUT_05150 [Kiloniellaceae bacterium]